MDSDDAQIRRQFSRAVASMFTEATATRLFEQFNQIAWLRYEASESVGTVLLTTPSRAEVGQVLALTTPLDLSDLRGVRKLLQLSSGQFSLLCDGTEVFGLGHRLGDAPWTPRVEFQGYGRWRLSSCEKSWIQVDSPPARPLGRGQSEQLFKECLHGLFGLVPSAHQLWELTLAAGRQARGTNMLVSPQARAEVSRLRSQCTLVVPVTLTPQLVERVTSIDGTVIVDLDGVCHAVGAILDGEVSPRGDRTRGGRYNSALMYVDSCPLPSLIVVVSQDGLVDYVFSPDRLQRA